MRRGPGWEAQVAREERRALRLAAGAVPLTLAERRPLEFLVDKARMASLPRSCARLAAISSCILSASGSYG